MRKAFKASRLIGPLSLALGLIAFSATAAQAETGAFWEVNGAKLTGSASVQAKNDTPTSTLLSKSGSMVVAITCKTIKLVNGTLFSTGGSGKFHYAECITKLDGVESKRCVPRSVGAAEGLIETNALTALILLHEPSPGTKIDILDLAPTTGTTIVTVVFGGGLCVLPTTDISGSVTLKDCKEEGLVNKVEHLFEEGPLSKLTFGINPATTDGSAWGFLTGANAGQMFSAHPV